MSHVKSVCDKSFTFYRGCGRKTHPREDWALSWAVRCVDVFRSGNPLSTYEPLLITTVWSFGLCVLVPRDTGGRFVVTCLGPWRGLTLTPGLCVSKFPEPVQCVVRTLWRPGFSHKGFSRGVEGLCPTRVKTFLSRFPDRTQTN